MAAPLAVAVAAMLGACASDSGQPLTTITLADGDAGSTVNAEVGQTLGLTLHTIGPGSYDVPSSSEPVLRFVGEDDPKVQNPGGPTQLYEFRAQTAGTVTVTIPHTYRPDPFSMTVVVR